MCCLLAVLVFLGPRAVIAFWWLADQNYWSRVFDTFFIPFAGFLFLPWTTLLWAVLGGNIEGFEWLFIALGVVTDILSYSGSAYGNRNRIPGYPGSAPRAY
jgi:hypothetical protein